MASKKVKIALAKINSKLRQWTFETRGTPEDFVGHVVDENGLCQLTIRENEDYNQLSRLLNTSKYMRDPHDMKGLANYLMDRIVIPNMEQEEKDAYNKQKVKGCLIELKEIRI